jgi:hypothetical protein
MAEQYFIGTYEPQRGQCSEGIEPGSNVGDGDLHSKIALEPSIHRFLQLPQVVVPERQRRSREEPLVDYSKSIMLTSEKYLQSMELKAERKKKAKAEAELRKLEADKKKESRAAEKLQKKVEKAQREVDARAREAFKQKEYRCYPRSKREPAMACEECTTSPAWCIQGTLLWSFA